MKPQAPDRRVLLTAALTAAVILTGVACQFAYHAKRAHCAEVIRGYYPKYFKREPDPASYHFWVTWAANKWPLEKVERVGFIEPAQKGARKSW